MSDNTGWTFDYPLSKVQIGYLLWLSSDFKRLPTLEDVDRFTEAEARELVFLHRYFKLSNGID